MLVTKPAPQFTATAIMGDNSFKEISLSDYKGKKVVLFFYPLDFTFVCPTEILAFDHRLPEFEKRNVQVIGCSVDSKWSHFGWKNTDTKNGGIGNIQYPILADLDKKIARAYDVLDGSTPATVLTDEGEEETTVGGEKALRASFLIDEDGIIRHAVINDLPLGRNVDEMLRMVDALTFNQEHGEVCPAGWQEGDEGMKENFLGVATYLEKNADRL
ncbi:MAG: peroxiredoxin [Candidatus Marinimicrobia bacterium]|nr:peroxiredoxin [Candidatus Neomarinimicrobiota bacterium]